MPLHYNPLAQYNHPLPMAHYLPAWLDAFLLAPFTWLPSPLASFWLGTALLAAYATLLGELVAGLLFMTHKSYYHELQDKMIHMHNVSVDALHQSDKESYLAANKLAQEAFGKTFFSEATLGMASIVPAPFALAWLDQRFSGIPLLTVPIVNHELSYPFVFLLLYIFFRIMFSKWKKHLPFFRTIHAIKLKAKEARGPIRRFIPDAPKSDHK